MASSPGGKLRPNALAVLRLITNSNLIDCMTGRSAGFSPLRIRPVYTPAWRYACDETLLKRAGICRDFSHLGIAFCRGLQIPARFVSCYAYGLVPSDFHAVFEAYLDRSWWLFDATRQAHLDGLVRIGTGRDAAEVAFSTPYGTFEPKKMEVRIARPAGGDQGPRTVDAISTDDAFDCSKPG